MRHHKNKATAGLLVCELLLNSCGTRSVTDTHPQRTAAGPVQTPSKSHWSTLAPGHELAFTNPAVARELTQNEITEITAAVGGVTGDPTVRFVSVSNDAGKKLVDIWTFRYKISCQHISRGRWTVQTVADYAY